MTVWKGWEGTGGGGEERRGEERRGEERRGEERRGEERRGEERRGEERRGEGVGGRVQCSLKTAGAVHVECCPHAMCWGKCATQDVGWYLVLNTAWHWLRAWTSGLETHCVAQPTAWERSGTRWTRHVRPWRQAQHVHEALVASGRADTSYATIM